MDHPDVLSQFLFGYKTPETGPMDSHVYAIIDGALDEKFHEQMIKLEPFFKNLHTGQLAEDLDTASPWLVRLEQKHPFTQWFLQNIYARRAACLFRSNENNLDDLARHFSVYSNIQLEQELMQDPGDGLLAFYDPAVFPVFRSLLDNDEAALFFEPVSVWYYETHLQPETLNAVTWTSSGWWEQSYKLDELLTMDEIPWHPMTESVINHNNKKNIPFLNLDQQDILYNVNRRLYCRGLVKDIRGEYHFDESNEELENQSMRYLLQAEDLFLETDAEQAHYILAALIHGSRFTGNSEVQDTLKDQHEDAESRSFFIQQWLEDNKHNKKGEI